MSDLGKKCKQNDKPQKLAAKWYLESLGYTDVKIISVGSDIICQKDGITYRVEVKGADSENKGKRAGIDNKYFGAATHTEIKQALENEDTYLWLFAFRADDRPENAYNYSEGWKFVIYTTDELIPYLTIPPMKYYIDLPALNASKPKQGKVSKEAKSIKNLTKDKIKNIIMTWDGMKDNNK